MRLSGRQQDVIAYLRGKEWTSPTEIGGMVWGFPHHSATASPVCKRLVERGLLERNERGHYRILSNNALCVKQISRNASREA